jgi:hypothetical protein
MVAAEYRPLSHKERELIACFWNTGRPARQISSLSWTPWGREVVAAADAPALSSTFLWMRHSSLYRKPWMRPSWADLGDEDVGLRLSAGGGVLSGLEVYTFGEVNHPSSLPEISTLRPWS